jgi:hypothetical protein
MTSNINPNNIDGAYPIAGQDNNSQGFRDNFTNTKTNFSYAAAEITDLQNKAVLKQALTGQTLNNNMLGSILSNAQIQNFGATRVALGTLSGTITVNYTAGNYQTVTTNGSISLEFQNFLASGILNLITLQITVASVAHTVTFPAAVTVNAAGIQGLNTATNVMTFAAVGTYTFTFTTSDGGYTISIDETNKEIQPFSATKDLVTDGGDGPIDLSTSTSYFVTTTASGATLPDGAEGQVKVLIAKDVSDGDMTVTVTNYGWDDGITTTGTITFDGFGQACTLQFTDGLWYCIGNNGATFD